MSFRDDFLHSQYFGLCHISCFEVSRLSALAAGRAAGKFTAMEGGNNDELRRSAADAAAPWWHSSGGGFPKLAMMSGAK